MPNTVAEWGVQVVWGCGDLLLWYMKGCREGLGLMPTTQTEHEGSGWGWRWLNGVVCGCVDPLQWYMRRQRAG